MHVNYVHPVFPESPGKVYRLGSYEEAIGTLHNIKVEDGLLLVEIGSLTLLLPVDMEHELRLHIASRIGILRTDDSLRPYRFRVIPDRPPASSTSQPTEVVS